jgi:TIR domain
LIIKCKICGSNGTIQSGDPFGNIFGRNMKPCPSCKGAGEFDLNVPQERLTTCKFCGGLGVIRSAGVAGFVPTGTVCPTCNGLGVLERPQIGIKKVSETKPEAAFPSRPQEVQYDLAISFAGEDRTIVQSYAKTIKDQGLNIFYADFEEVDLWGTNLYDTFDTIYRLKAHYCVIFLSRHYAIKVWTNHERRSAQAMALIENREYILPVKLDDTEIPGITQTIGYLDYRKTGHEGLVRATLEKLSRNRSPLTG